MQTRERELEHRAPLGLLREPRRRAVYHVLVDDADRAGLGRRHDDLVLEERGRDCGKDLRLAVVFGRIVVSEKELPNIFE